MARPWLIGTAFALCLFVAFSAMAWVSVQAVRLDEAEARAMRQVALEEDARLALGRMDAILTPLLAQENGRPYFAYRAFYSPDRAYTEMFAPIQKNRIRVASPLLTFRSDEVLLHFQIAPNGDMTSPQVPLSNMRDVAEKDFRKHERIEAAGKLLAVLRNKFARNDLLAALPKSSMPVLNHEQNLTLVPNVQNQEELALLPPSNGNSGANVNPNIAPNINDADGSNRNSNNDNRANPGSNSPESIRSDVQGNVDQQTEAQQQSTSPSQQELLITQRQELQNPQGSQNEVPQQSDQQQGVQPNRPQSSAQLRYGNAPLQQKGSGKLNAKASSRLGQKGVSEYQARANDWQVSNQNTINQKREQFADVTGDVDEGVMVPMWIDGALVIARRVVVQGDVYVQGVWMNWPTVEANLLASVNDLFPDAAIAPVAGIGAQGTSRMLTAIPATLMLDEAAIIASAVGDDSAATATVLAVAWVCMLLAIVAVGVLFRGALTLSERRGAFVSAVTHELRTPLTTFRMYTEMLQRGMITDEVKRDDYLGTMRNEAERLSHLVENVLAYAKLERGSPASRMKVLSVQDLFAGITPRLSQRAGQADMSLIVDTASLSGTKVHADPGAVEQVLFNLVDNACKYAQDAADRRIHLDVTRHNGMVELCVRDHGPGVSRAEERRLFQPFRKSARDAAHSAPGVGLGLALSKRLAHAMGGQLRIRDCDAIDASSEGDVCGACFALTLSVRDE